MISLAVSLCVLSGSIAAEDTRLRTSIFESTSFDEALRRSRETDNILLLVFTAEWCGSCGVMDLRSWRDEQVGRWLRKNAIAIKVDLDEEETAARYFDVQAVPTVIALRRGTVADRMSGVRPPEELLRWLQGIGRGETEDVRLERLARDGGVPERYALAKYRLACSQLEEALPHFLWLWNEALAQEPAWFAVRRTFLIADLEELLRRSAGARDEFTGIRDAIEDRVRAGTFTPALLEDWLALNFALEDEERTVLWFDAVKHAPPAELSFAQLEQWLAPLFLARGRWSDFALLYPDPVARLRLIARVSAEMQASVSVALAEDMPAAMLRKIAGDLLRALVAAGRLREADELDAEARQLDPSANMVEALRAARTAAVD